MSKHNPARTQSLTGAIFLGRQERSYPAPVRGLNQNTRITWRSSLSSLRPRQDWEIILVAVRTWWTVRLVVCKNLIIIIIKTSNYKISKMSWDLNQDSSQSLVIMCNQKLLKLRNQSILKTEISERYLCIFLIYISGWVWFWWLYHEPNRSELFPWFSVSKLNKRRWMKNICSKIPIQFQSIFIIAVGASLARH